MNAINTALFYETNRLSRLKQLNLLDTLPEERFDRITRIAQETFGVAIALVTLIDEDRQWFKSRQGTSEVSTPRSLAFCDHVIRQEEVFLVEDATRDTRFSQNSLVTGEPFIRFYAGVPLREPGGFKVGALCIIDSVPRSPSDRELAFLKDLAYLVESELEKGVYPEPGAGSLEAGALNRSLRICQRQLSRNVSDQQKLSTVVNQMVSLTGSAGGFVIDAWQAEEGVPPSIAVVRTPAQMVDQEDLWSSLKEGVVDYLQIDALISGRCSTNSAGYPLMADSTFRGMVVLLGRATPYPDSLIFELSPLMQLAVVAMERRSLHSEKAGATVKSRSGGYGPDYLERRNLHCLVSRELQRANLRGGSLSVCLLDIDDFRGVNETFGKNAGDQVLCQIAARLRNAVGKEDLVVAAGGDEFAVLLKDVSSNAAYARVIDAFRQPFRTSAGKIELSGSMGVSVYPLDPSDSETLLRHAEQAMCLAKEDGRGRFKLFDVYRFKAKEKRVALIHSIERALDNDEFVLFLQPKICLENQRLQGFEALIRWQHPQRGTLTPEHFLSAIEASPLEERLGRFVLGSGMELLSMFSEQGLDYSLSVNLSPSHFLDENFLQNLEESLSLYPADIRPNLTLEILETTAWDDQEAAARIVQGCKQLGLSVSLDDFGTGFSSLSYFRKLALDEIKIDKSFVMEMLEQPNDQTIVESIISLSKRFGRKVVAEGIESEVVARRLTELGCDVGQGYFYSRPLPIKQALQWATSFDNANDVSGCPVH